MTALSIALSAVEMLLGIGIFLVGAYLQNGELMAVATLMVILSVLVGVGVEADDDR